MCSNKQKNTIIIQSVWYTNAQRMGCVLLKALLDASIINIFCAACYTISFALAFGWVYGARTRTSKCKLVAFVFLLPFLMGYAQNTNQDLIYQLLFSWLKLLFKLLECCAACGMSCQWLTFITKIDSFVPQQNSAVRCHFCTLKSNKYLATTKKQI